MRDRSSIVQEMDRILNLRWLLENRQLRTLSAFC
jgi:hypothetical protein